MKLITLFALLSFTSFAQANFSTESFAGQFKVGDCALIAVPASAQVTVDADKITLVLTNATNTVTSEIYLNSEKALELGVEAQVLTKTHSITNLLLFDGSPIAKVKLARSASGNRLHLSNLNLERNTNHACSLYR